jgi:hypothetical protein
LKLSKTSWLILGVGVVILAFASLGMVRSQQTDWEDQLKQELALAEKGLGKSQLREFSTQKQELEEQLSQLESQLQVVKSELDQSVASIDVTDSVFGIAEQCGVTIVELNSPGVAEEKLEGLLCSAISLDIIAEGEVADLLSFIVRLNNDFVTGMVRSAEISVPGPAIAERPSANIEFIVYAYRGG